MRYNIRKTNIIYHKNSNCVDIYINNFLQKLFMMSDIISICLLIGNDMKTRVFISPNQFFYYELKVHNRKLLNQKLLKDINIILLFILMINVETEYSELSLFLKENNVHIPSKDKDLDIYEMIEQVFELNNPTTAFYIINLGNIIRQYKLWRELFPYIEPRYAVKCNPNRVICQLLSLLGVGFDVASKNEINLVKDYVNIDKVIYANPYKESSSIQYARSMDVDTSVFDSEDELYKMKIYHPKGKLLMRIKVDDKYAYCIGASARCETGAPVKGGIYNGGTTYRSTCDDGSNMICNNFYPLNFSTLDASSVKQCIGVKGNKGDKNLMKDAVLKKHLLYGIGVNPNLFDEHGIDAIAVSYCQCVTYLSP